MTSYSASKPPIESPSRRLLKTEKARRLAKEGNPFPLIALLWPTMLVRNEEHARWLEGKIVPEDDPNFLSEAWDDPCLCLDYWQRDLISSVFTPGYRQVLTKGCAKAGKGASTAIAVCLWWYLHDPCKIVLTGPKFDHVKNLSMFPEVKRWLRSMTDQRQTIINSESVNWPDTEDKCIQIGNADAAEGFSGIHGPHTMVVFDESTAIDGVFFNQAKTLARVILALSNPRAGPGWFRSCFPPDNPDETQTVEVPSGKRRLITVSGHDCCNVKAGFEIIPSQITREILAENLDPIGKPDWWPACFGLGQFPTEDTETMLFTNSWIDRAEKRWLELKGPSGRPQIQARAAGLDVGASEQGDPSCLAVAGFEAIIKLHEPKKQSNTMQLVPWLINLMRSQYGVDITQGYFPVEIDVNGVGKGVFDRLRERGVLVLASNTQTKSLKATRMYGNHRAERYGELSRRLNPGDAEGVEPFGLPVDPDLRAELLVHEKIYTLSTGSFLVTPKKKLPGANFNGDTIYDRIRRSPNRSDAVVYAFSALSTLRRKRTPRVNRNLVLGTSLDGEQQEQMRRMTDRTVETVSDIAARVAREMDEKDDWEW